MPETILDQRDDLAMSSLRTIESAPRAHPPAPSSDLATRVAATRVSQNHRAICETLGRDALTHAPFAWARTIPEEGYRDGRIIGKTGRTVTSDPKAWLSQKMQQAGPGWRERAEAIRRSQLIRTCECSTPLYFVSRYGTHPSEYLQAEVWEVTERPSKDLTTDRWLWTRQEDVVDWGHPDEKASIGKPHYHLQQMIDVRDEVQTRAQQRRVAFNERLELTKDKIVVEVTVPGGNQTRYRAGDRIDFQRTPGLSPLQRWFSDWQATSAGKQAIEDYWVLASSGIPRWVHRRKLPKMPRVTMSDERFMEWLRRFDDLVGHHMAFYFHGLFGNRLHADAIERAFDLAKTGAFDLPERDWQVLVEWKNQPYGF